MVLRHACSGRLDVEIRVDGVQLRQVDAFKYLGFIVTPGLSFTAHLTRAVERARAAALIVASLIARLAINDLARLGAYYKCYVESQFYCLELAPCSILNHLCSVRSLFVRSVFDLPISTSHELAVVLFDLPPPEKTLVKRKSRFHASVASHSFPFVRDALKIDRVRLIGSIFSWHNGLVCLLRKVLGEISTVSFDARSQLLRAELVFSAEDYNFFYIQECSDSDTLSFFRLFNSPRVLHSFRDFLESLSFPQRRLVVLFSSSLLRFRFCSFPRECCPLCGKKWLWEHFFTCPRLDVLPGFSNHAYVLREIRQHVADGQWDVFLHYLRFYLLERHDLLSTVTFPRDVIDELC